MGWKYLVSISPENFFIPSLFFFPLSAAATGDLKDFALVPSSGVDFGGSMFQSLLCRAGVTLERKLINGDSSSLSSLAPSAKYFLFAAFQNPNVLISNSRVTSVVYSFSTTSNISTDVTSSSSDSSFVVSYLINSCGLSQNQAITASKKLNFKTTSKPDSVLTLLKAYGFTDSHISSLISKVPSILSLKPDKTLKPKLDFFNSRGLSGVHLADFISIHPMILLRSLNNEIIPCFDILESFVQSDQNVIKMIRRNSWILRTNKAKNLMVNVELLRNEGVPEANISKYLIHQPRAYTENASRFKEIVEKVKDMGFDHLESRFLTAIHALTSMTEDSWKKKKDVYRRWGWSEDQIHTAFRKSPICMTLSEKKIMALMNFLVNEAGYDSLTVAENPIVFCSSLEARIIPRCSVIRILVSKGLIQENIPLSSLSVTVDNYFLDRFVTKYEQEIPELMKIFQAKSVVMKPSPATTIITTDTIS